MKDPTSASRDEPASRAKRPREPAKIDRSLLPRAGVNRIIGLLEILDEAGGKDDVYRLAAAIHYTIGDLQQITEGAEALGFVSIDQGDILMTPLGKLFVDADVNTRKEMFRKQLGLLPAFQHVVAALKRRRGRRMSVDVLEKFLRTVLVPDEVLHVMGHFIEWGRFGELLGYDPNERLIYLDHEV